MAILGESVRVLITVKTSPQPSTKYGDTVRVAGIRIDGGRHDWIRPYPIPFRYLGSDQQFKKYDVVELTVRRRHQDGRAESYSPEWASIHVVDHFRDWSPRVEVMNEVDVTTTCDLRACTMANANGTSLGFVGVSDVSGLKFEKHPGWTDAEKRKISHALEQVDLFGDANTPPRLIAPTFKVRYRYRCAHTAWPGHDGQILDWELTELQRMLQHDSDVDAKRKITDKFLTMMFNESRQTRFFMGNFEDATKRHNFSVLGVYYPKLSVASGQTLF